MPKPFAGAEIRVLAENIGFKEGFSPSRLPWLKAALFAALGAAVLSILLPYQMLGQILVWLSCAVITLLAI